MLILITLPCLCNRASNNASLSPCRIDAPFPAVLSTIPSRAVPEQVFGAISSGSQHPMARWTETEGSPQSSNNPLSESLEDFDIVYTSSGRRTHRASGMAPAETEANHIEIDDAATSSSIRKRRRKSGQIDPGEVLKKPAYQKDKSGPVDVPQTEVEPHNSQNMPTGTAKVEDLEYQRMYLDHDEEGDGNVPLVDEVDKAYKDEGDVEKEQGSTRLVPDHQAQDGRRSLTGSPEIVSSFNSRSTRRATPATRRTPTTPSTLLTPLHRSQTASNLGLSLSNNADMNEDTVRVDESMQSKCKSVEDSIEVSSDETESPSK